APLERGARTPSLEGGRWCGVRAWRYREGWGGSALHGTVDGSGLRLRFRRAGRGQVHQRLEQSFEVVVVHPGDGAPGHGLGDLVIVGVDAGAHGPDELLQRPGRDQREVGTDRTDLAFDAAMEILTVAGAAVLIGEQVGAPGESRALRRRQDRP